MSETPFQVKDGRGHGWHVVDDAVTDALVRPWPTLTAAQQNPEISVRWGDAKAVYDVLARCANKDQECWPGFTFIEERTEFSRPHVGKCIRFLEACGLIEVTRRERMNNVYKLLNPWETGFTSPGKRYLPAEKSLGNGFSQAGKPGSPALVNPVYRKGYPENHTQEPDEEAPPPPDGGEGVTRGNTPASRSGVKPEGNKPPSPPPAEGPGGDPPGAPASGAGVPRTTKFRLAELTLDEKRAFRQELLVYAYDRLKIDFARLAADAGEANAKNWIVARFDAPDDGFWSYWHPQKSTKAHKSWKDWKATFANNVLTNAEHGVRGLKKFIRQRGDASPAAPKSAASLAAQAERFRNRHAATHEAKR
ncbi:MAG: helix-turn-helix domain-containing protein [Bdellovibrionota bacterium]